MNFLRYFWLSCSGFKTYIPLLNIPLKSSLGYWAFLSALLSVVAIFNILHWFKIGYPVIVREASAHLPAFSLTNGVAYSAEPQPLYSNTNQFPIILDLNEEVASPQNMFPRGGLILKKKQMEFWLENSPPKILPWEKMEDGEVNKAYLERLGDQITQIIPYFFPIIWLIFLLLGILQALLFTMFAGLLERSMEPRFDFSQLFNLSLFSLTPCSLIIAVYASIGFGEVSYPMIYFVCYCFFVVMASGYCRASLVTPPPRLNSNSGYEDPDA